MQPFSLSELYFVGQVLYNVCTGKILKGSTVKHRKVIRKYRWVEMDKSVTLKEQVQTLQVVTENEFNEFLETYSDFLEVRSIGFVDRYYNDYNELVGVQDGLESFYLKSTLKSN